MLLTITYKGKNTQDLGYLLHKNPYRAQSFELSFGKAYVFYPEVSDERTACALLIDIDPIDIVRGKQNSGERGLFDYVNDRPYVSSSFTCNALARVFGTAMTGRCDERPELAKSRLELEACVHMLPSRDEGALASEVFGPLGYETEIRTTVLDERFPGWGMSPYIDLTIRGKVTLSQLLNHLYVLIPVFDRRKHYYETEDEIEKLLKHGEGWLKDHPMRNRIARRYFGTKKSFALKAIDRLREDDAPAEESADDDAAEKSPAETEAAEKRISLNRRRLEAVRNAVIESGARSVIDMGCGECRLTSMLIAEKQIERAAACDVSVKALEKAKQVLRYESMRPYLKEKLKLFQASLTYRDDRFKGYDAAAAVEVIEHLDPDRLPAFERTVFGFAACDTVIVTTPNREYNAVYEWLPEGEMRHRDHRFEWSRDEFEKWAARISCEYGYTAEISGIGDVDANHGQPTMMGVFRKCV